MTSWTGPEVVIAALTALTPLAVVALGVLVAGTARRLESVQWANQIVVARRLELFAEVAPKLNRLLCFATFVGRWKEITPQQAIALKRDLDEVVYSNRLLFSPELFDAYKAFMTTFFAMYAATPGGDARIRVGIDSVWGDRRNLPWWQDAMVDLFTADQKSTMDEVHAAYTALSDAFRTDLYVTGLTQPLLPPRAT